MADVANSLSLCLPHDLLGAVQAASVKWNASHQVSRLWQHDARLWTNHGEEKWLGWLNVVEDAELMASALRTFQAEVKARDFKHCVLLGMGGSSLCPEVLSLSFSTTLPLNSGYPILQILDSTDPAQITTLESQIEYKSTLFIVASKSGSTLEPNLFEQYFYSQALRALGSAKLASRHFVAITDPGSHLETLAREKNYWQIFAGNPAIGGRYSALSVFGLIPAAAIGLDLTRFMANAKLMSDSAKLPTAGLGASSDASSDAGSGATAGPTGDRDCDVEQNSALALGLTLGLAASQGRDKLTILVSPAIASFGAWLEQLIAESTGKDGRGIIPLAGEPLLSPAAYGKDRIFSYFRLSGHSDAKQETLLNELKAAGHPVIITELTNQYGLAQEFFRWQIATAVAGSVLKINPFDQPDVEASKIETKKLTEEFETNGRLPTEHPIFEDQDFALYAASGPATVRPSDNGKMSLEEILARHLDSIKAGDYFALLAYIERNETHEGLLAQIRASVAKARLVATCGEFGPRFLHSTGQAYKGGPNTGVFLQVTCADLNDLSLPKRKLTFGTVKAAQARGDFNVLGERNRRALRIHLKDGDAFGGLKRIKTAIKNWSST